MAMMKEGMWKKVRVRRNGVTLNGKCYWNETLHEYIGEEVFVQSAGMQSILVTNLSGKTICTAEIDLIFDHGSSPKGVMSELRRAVYILEEQGFSVNYASYERYGDIHGSSYEASLVTGAIVLRIVPPEEIKTK
jgi:hypothetical protein